jgi:serine/threonine-protein kinase
MASIAAIATVAALAGWLLRGNSRGDAPPARFALVIPASQRVTPWAEPGSSISADGQLLLYNVDVDGVTRVYARRLTDPFGSPIPGSDGAVGPVLSPEGDWFIYTNAAYGVWRKMPVQGGASIAIPLPRGVTAAVMRWNGNDGYVTTLGSGELAFLRGTGALDTIAAPDRARQEQSLEIMQVLPDGNLLAIATDLWPAGHVVIINARTGARTEVHGGATSWASTSGDHLVWADPVGALFASPFDGKRVTGPARSLGAQAQTTRGGRPKVSAARNAGALAYIPVQPASLARVGRDGRARTLLANPRTYHNPRVSPDGRKVSLDISDTERDVWLLDLEDTTLSRITFEASGHDAIFTPDGQHIVFAVARGNVIGAYIRRIDGAGSTDSVLTAGAQYSIHTITPDGRFGIGVKTTGVSTAGFDLVSVPLMGGDRKGSTVLESRYMEGYPALSPDGRWLAYSSDESGRAEVYVRPWPGPGPKIVISQHGGIEPIWSRDGRELFYRGPSAGMPFLIAAAIETRPSFRVASRTPLFDDADYETSTPHANYDVMPDGSFIMVRLARASEFTYLQNWPALMQQQASGGTP